MYLRLEQLTKVFPGRGGSADVLAVDDVSLDIERGEFVTLLGPSGCGKTTTLRLIAGFEFPTRGRIVLDGQEINHLPPNRRDMAMVFQSYAVFPHLSVFENIAYGLRVKKLPGDEIRQRVREVMELTELTGLENRQPNELSGGQQQRVALARALVMEPKVLLFDEPLSNLDAKLRVQMRSEIRRIQQELAITSVYVTHDQEEAMVLSDRIVVMDQGRIQQVGTAPEIYRRPRNRFVADFIGRANFLPGVVEQVDAENVHVRVYQVSVPVPRLDAVTFHPGQEVWILLRPESVRMHLEAPPGPAFVGDVVRTSYLGAWAEYEVAIDGQRILAVQYNPAEEELIPPGTQVHAEPIRSNLYLLPGEERVPAGTSA